MTPLVSILTTSYNYANYVGKTVQSVLDQTYPHWEMIICDDGSSDGSVEILQSFKDPRITLILFPENQGGFKSYAAVLERKRGEYVVSLDSDDWIHPERLEKQVAALEADPALDILCTDICEIDSAGNEVGEAGAYQQWFNHRLDLNQIETWIWSNRLCNSSVMMRATVLDEIGAHDTRFKYTPDYEFWLRCLIAKKKFGALHEPLTYYRGHGRNATHGNLARTFSEVQILTRDYLIPQAMHEGKPLSAASALEAFQKHPYYLSADQKMKKELSLLAFNDQSFGLQQIEEFKISLLDMVVSLAEQVRALETALALKESNLSQKTADLNKIGVEYEIYKGRTLVRAASLIHKLLGGRK